MAKIIHILPHNIEGFMAGDYSNFDHHSSRFLAKIADFWQKQNPSLVLNQELWTLSKKLKEPQTFQHQKGFAVKLFPISNRLPLPLETSKALLNEVKNYQAQEPIVWHLHSYYLLMNDFLAAALAKRKQKYVMHFRGAGFSQSPKGFFYSLYHYLIGLRLAFKKASYLFIQNQDEIKRIKRWRLAKEQQIVYFPNTVPLANLASPSQRNQDSLKQQWKLLIAGRAEKITNSPANMKALNKILKQNQQCLLEIAGLKTENQLLNKLKASFPKQVVLTSWLDKKTLLAKFQQADLLLYITEKEGSPMGLIEALSQGLPAISFDTEGVRDVVQNNFNGYLIKDIKELPDKIKEAANQPQKLSAMRANALNHIKSHFADELYFPKLIEMYLSLIHNS
jgi:glycosyltransferase involved in cell wall biosynthesis